MNRTFNKKLNREVVYFDDNTVDLYKDGVRVGERRPRPEGHDWLHGTEGITLPYSPSVDEMLDQIANKLQDDVKRIMLACSENEGWLRDMYSRSKESGLSVRPPQR